MRWVSIAGLGFVVGCATGGAAADGSAGGDAGRPDAGSAAQVCVVRCGEASTCCGAGTECVGERCLPECAGARCGADETTCCAGGELCVEGVGCEAPAGSCIDEIDCAEGSYCDLGLGRCVRRGTGETLCEYRPPPEVFDPVEIWRWDGDGSMALPLVVQLTDDNDDGAIDARDVPDVVLPVFNGDFFDLIPNLVGRLVALSGDDGRLLWESDPSVPVCAVASPAGADVDGDGTLEIATIVAAEDGRCMHGLPGGRLALIDHEGSYEWIGSEDSHLGWDAMAIGNADGAGDAEILAGGVLYSSDGRVLWRDDYLAGNLSGAIPFFADLDADPQLEIVSGVGVWEHDGRRKWTVDGLEPLGVRDRGVALGWLVRRGPTPEPQLVVADAHEFRVYDARNGDVIVGPIRYEATEGGVNDSAGPPTIADFDGDGHAEVGIAGFAHYVLLDFDEPAPHLRWAVESQDGSSGSVGSTVFDFDGNGAAEVVLSDECEVRIMNGATGAPIWSGNASSLTALEYAVVADVDGDGTANLVVPSYSSQPGEPDSSCAARGIEEHRATTGVRVYRDRLDNWIDARPIWNQHAYSVDNVTTDGRIPTEHVPSWETHNTFRLNRFPSPDTVFLAPNLEVTTLGLDQRRCPAELVLRARIQNRGSRSAPAGLPVTFYREAPGGPESLGTGRTRAPLGPGGAEWVELAVDDVELDPMNAISFHVVADDTGAGEGTLNECDEDNRSSTARVSCDLL